MDVAPGTIVVYSDVSCPWAHIAVYQLHSMRAKLSLHDEKPTITASASLWSRTTVPRSTRTS